MNCIALIQARMSSTRFPGKVLEDLGGRPSIVFMVERVRHARRLQEVVVVTSTDPSDDPLVRVLRDYGIAHHRGALHDVLNRYAGAAAAWPADAYMRLTGDCPLIDPLVLDAIVGLLQATGSDYSSNIDPPTYPDGLDCECFTAATLARCHAEAREPAEREHVTLWMRGTAAGLRRVNLTLPVDASGIRLTVDYPDDLAAVRRVLAGLPAKRPFDTYDLLTAIARDPGLRDINPHRRDEALSKGPGDDDSHGATP